MPKIQYLYKTRQGIPGIYAQKFGDILQNMNFSRYYRNRGKFIYGFDPNIINIRVYGIYDKYTFTAKNIWGDVKGTGIAYKPMGLYVAQTTYVK